MHAYLYGMAIKKAESVSIAKKKQDKMSFQPDKGYRDIMDKAIKDEIYGPKRNYSFIINEGLKLLFERDGLLLKPKK
jgi:hypothetical protein